MASGTAYGHVVRPEVGGPREGGDRTPGGPLQRLDRSAPRVPGSPGWLFHLVLALVGALCLSAASIPGGVGALLFMFSGAVFVAAALAWGAWLLRWAVARARHEATQPVRWFLVAPVCGAMFVGTLVLDLPLRARWSLAQPSFDRIVETAPPAPEPGQALQFEVPDVAGTYRLEGAQRVGDDVFVSVRSDLVDGAVLNAGFLSASGFAYLPTGQLPSPELFAGGFEVHHRHVRGRWYAWSSHW